MDPELIAYLDRRFDETHRQIDEFRQETNQRLEKIDERFEKVEEEIHKTGIQVEHLESMIQLLSEGMAVQDAKLERLREELRAEIRDVRHNLERFAEYVRGRFDLLEELEVRVTRLEERLAS